MVIEFQIWGRQKRKKGGNPEYGGLTMRGGEAGRRERERNKGRNYGKKIVGVFAGIN